MNSKRDLENHTEYLKKIIQDIEEYNKKFEQNFFLGAYTEDYCSLTFDEIAHCSVIIEQEQIVKTRHPLVFQKCHPSHNKV